MAAFPRNYRLRKVKFPDPVEQAQVVFATRPEEMRKAYDAKQSLLQSCSDYKNTMSGIDFSNQRLFQTVTDTMKKTSLPGLLLKGDTEELKKFLQGLQLMSGQPEFKEMLEKAKPMLLEVVKQVKDTDPELKKLLETLTDRVPNFPQLPSDQRWDVKPKLSMQATEEYVEMIRSNQDPVFGFVFYDYDSDDVVLKRKITQGELPTFRIGLPIFMKRKPIHVIGIKSEDGKLVITITARGNDNLKIDFNMRLFNMCTSNTVDETEKDRYMKMIDFCIKDELDILVAEVTKDPKLLEARELKESKKFMEWIYPKYVEPVMVKTVSPEPESTSKPAIPETPRMQMRSDTKKLQEQEFKTPISVPVKSEYTLSPEGKTLLTEYTKSGKDKKTAKQQIKQMAKDDPTQFGDLVVKKGSGVKIKKIIIPPSKLARFDRIKVILGALEADSTADYLEEYTAIVDSLLTDKMVTKDQHKFLIQKYFDCK